MTQSAAPGPSTRSAIPSFIVMDVMRAAAAREATGANVIHMEVGQPATPAPRAARDAVRQALETDNLGYTMALGTDALRARIAQHYFDTYSVAVEPERVIVTQGSSAAFVLAFLAAFDAGDAVALPSPGYPCYRWMPTVDGVAQAANQPGVKGLLIASPANPTGTMIEPDRLAAINALCVRRGLWFISDEIYHGLTYTGPAQTALATNPDAIIINSFSKYFSMTGWRVGWMVVPKRLVRPIERLAQNLYISPPAIAQVAALAAFDARDELEANRRVYQANRELLLAGLPGAGFTNLVPADGAFYLYADISNLTDDSAAFARRMLDETGVATTPGVDFDSERGASFLRFSYAGSTANIAEAVARLTAWKNGG
jgi:aspartate/methionine/tyrosine aminotransferase